MPDDMMTGDGGGGNVLGSGMPSPQGGPGLAPVPQGPPPSLDQQLDELGAKYQKLTSAGAMLSRVRMTLDSLAKMADMVSTEDVIKGAGQLVASGLDPLSVAGLLADMPQAGEQLASWVKGHDADVRKREAQLATVTSGIRHQMGVVGLRSLMEKSKGGGAPTMPVPQPGLGGNDLSGGGGLDG